MTPFRARTFKGYDYMTGCEVEFCRAKWRDILSAAACARRINGVLLTFVRQEGRSCIAYEIHDEGSLGNPRRHQEVGRRGIA